MCLGIISSLELGVFFVVINYFCLSLYKILTYFNFNYIIYSGLLIFCCQNVATFTYLYNENHIGQSLLYCLLYDKQYDSHYLSVGSNKLPDHHLTFMVFLFHHTHSVQYLSITEVCALASFYPASSNIQNLPKPHPTMP